MIDKESYSILKMFYKRTKVSKQDVYKKFHRLSQSFIDKLLYNLEITSHLIGNVYTGEFKNGCPILEEDVFEITLNGKVYVEDHRRGNRRWFVPVLISAISLLVSISALIISIGL